MGNQIVGSARLLGICCLGMLLAVAAKADSGVATISGEELSRLVDQGVTVVDVRRSDEWRSTGVINGSQLITAFDESGRLNPRFVADVSAAVGKDQPVALICRSGNRSAVAAQLLAKEAGFTKIYNVSGGISAWLGQGKPMGPCTSC